MKIAELALWRGRDGRVWEVLGDFEMALNYVQCALCEQKKQCQLEGGATEWAC